MANGKSGRKKLAKKLTITIISIIILVVASLLGIDVLDENPEVTLLETTVPAVEVTTIPTTEGTSEPIHNVTTVPIQNAEGELVVHMIDVGQADCFLLIQDDMTALVD